MMGRARMVILAVAPLLLAALWMDKQPAYKPYEAPVLAPPAESVPVSGGTKVGMAKPPKPTAASVAQGKILFEINCAICHGQTSDKVGPVGTKLKPPPPGLDHSLLQGLSDDLILNAMTLGFGRMPPFRDKLTPGERWQLLHFLRSRN